LSEVGTASLSLSPLRVRDRAGRLPEKTTPDNSIGLGGIKSPIQSSLVSLFGATGDERAERLRNGNSIKGPLSINRL